MKRCARSGAVARLVVPLVAVAIFAGCSSDTPGRAVGASPTAASAEGAAGESDLPAVSVRNLGTGETTDLGTLLPAGKPLLVWFWAPY